MRPRWLGLAVSALLIAAAAFLLLPKERGGEGVLAREPEPAASSADPRSEMLRPGDAARQALVSLRGTVGVAGEDTVLPGVAVSLSGPEAPSATVTDGLGRYELAGLAPEPIELLADAGYPFAPSSRQVDLEAGENVLDLRLEPRFALEVSALEADPAVELGYMPVAGASVRLTPPDLLPDGIANGPAPVTGADGRCLLDGIPAGIHALHVSAEGYLESVLLLPFRYSDLSIARHLRERGIAVRMTARGPTLRGRVVERSGAPVPGALVCLDTRPAQDRFQRSVDDGPPQAPPTARSGDGGEFELAIPPHLAASTLLVCAGRPDLAPIVRHGVRSTDPDHEHVVLVPAARPVEIRVARQDGSIAPGRITVRDGELAYDLLSDSLLARIPGFASAFAAPSEPGVLRLSLPQGGFTVVFEPDRPGSELKAFYIRVSADGPRTIALVLDV